MNAAAFFEVSTTGLLRLNASLVTQEKYPLKYRHVWQITT